MENNFSLIGNMEVKGDAPKANAFLNKIIGVLWPKRIVDIARAESDARTITAQSELTTERMKKEGEVDLAFDLRARARLRVEAEQDRQQENMEQIIRLALPDIKEEQAEPEKVDDDWMARFFEKTRNVTNAEMQALWARLLAGEANTPGSIAKRTLDFLGSLERSEGLAFSNLLNFGLSADTILPIITDHNDEIYVRNGIDFRVLVHLQTIGLISFETMTGFALRQQPKNVIAVYFDKIIRMEWPGEPPTSFSIGQVLLSQIGKQLSTVCDRTEVPGFAVHLSDYWESKGAKVSLETAVTPA